MEKVNPVKPKSETDSRAACVAWICSFSRNEMSHKTTRRRAESLLILMQKLEERWWDNFETEKIEYNNMHRIASRKKRTD